MGWTLAPREALTLLLDGHDCALIGVELVAGRLVGALGECAPGLLEAAAGEEVAVLTEPQAPILPRATATARVERRRDTPASFTHVSTARPGGVASRRHCTGGGLATRWV